MFIENRPDEVELLSFFESEPLSFERDNVSFLYTAKNQHGLTLDFSFSIVEGWVQYSMKLHGNELLHGSIDGVTSFGIRSDGLGDYIYIEVITKGSMSRLEVRIKPNMEVKSSYIIR